MEILQKFKQNGFFTADLYHLLAKKKMSDPSEPIIPSVYIKEMNMTTQERVQHLNNIVVDNLISLDNTPKTAVLSFSPRLLVFQNFKPNDKIVVKFTVKNVSKGPTFFNMAWKESSYFSIQACGGQMLSRLAPGISVTFAVTFTPIQYADYTHKINFHTETDEYVLPLIAMGPRPIFDFPDCITIPKTPLKLENNVIMSIHNVGVVPSGFTFKTRCPFSVQPQSAYLNVNERIDVRVGFKTMNLGDSVGYLYAVFETGEIFQIRASGSTHAVTVELEKPVVRFLDTYNTLIRQQTFKLYNKSNHLLTFMCMKNDCIYNDFEEKVKLATIFYNLKESETAKDMKVVQYDIVSSDEHERVYTRIFYDEMQSLVADETLQFHNTHFSITPITGNLWPNKETEITITFAPKEIGELSAIVYFDFDGVLGRVPLNVVGTSLPPRIQLNVETLDMDCVYVNKTYNYEIIATNKGHINGVIVYNEIPTLFGSHISCSPEIHCLRPGDKEIFVLSFLNSNQGPFFEEVHFTLRDTNVVLKLYLKGKVIYPSLTFSIPCLDFGVVSLGVPETRELEVINASVIDVSGSVKISSDGPEISSITLTDYAVSDTPKPLIPSWPREFDIKPTEFEMGPESTMILKVTLTANLIRTNQTQLELEIERSDSLPITLPVMYNAMVPEITPAPKIKLRECFVNYPYENEIIIKTNALSGYFTLEEPDDELSLKVDVAVKNGIIEPNSTISLPATIQTSVLGPQEHFVKLNLFGQSQPVEICHIMACGVRPIVTCNPIALNWGKVKLLTSSAKTLMLCNDSPIPVKFKAMLLHKDGKWTIEPTEGILAPESGTEFILTVYLVDADFHRNKAVIQLENVKEILVPLSATGVGTSIRVLDLGDSINLGRHFTKIHLKCNVIVENFGTKLHALEWSEHLKAPKTKNTKRPFFNLDPRELKIGARKQTELTITGLCTKASMIEETWYLFGTIEGNGKKELLMECPITAEFVDPKIEISSSVIDFQYDYGPYSEYYKLTDILTIKNVSTLPLNIDIRVRPPFAIFHKRSYKTLPEEEDLCCCIWYRESDLNVSNIVSEVGAYQSKIFIDYLTLKPVEPLRIGPLKFFQDIKKIKMAFRTTHTIEELLEDQEVMKMQILFDTTKHLTLRSRVYSDLMRIKFRGHNNKDAVTLIGKVNFPNMFIMFPRVDFQCLLNGTIGSKTIKIQNVTPLLVCYRFQWNTWFISTVAMPQTLQEKLSKVTGVNTLTTCSESHRVSTSPKLLCYEPVESKLCKVIDYENIPQNSPILEDKVEYTIHEDSKDDTTFWKSRLIKKIMPMIKTGDTAFPWAWKFPKFEKSNKIDINDVLQILPYKGLLKPYEIQYVNVVFQPTRNINVKAILECEVLGGPTESIIVTGQSSDLMYKMSTQKLNFKIRSFHETASEELLIVNIALLPFEYKTYLNEPKLKDELEGTILNIFPPEKLLESEEEAMLKINVRPGIVGYFHRTFLLEIGHLPHVPIEVYGWGVVPQVYLDLPRPGLAEQPNECAYQAISSLSVEYMTAISEIFSKNESEHYNSPYIDKCNEDPDLQYGWDICSSWDNYPSIMDIAMAEERMLLIKYIKQRPDIMTAYSTQSRVGPIPGFFIAPYVLDFGVVITDSTVQYSVDVVNYGPIATKLRFSKATKFPTWLSIQLCRKLIPGETGKLEITFNPTSKDFTQSQQSVETSLNLEVPYGISIPVQIKAIFGVPYLRSKVQKINFGSVRCGDKMICSIPLKNVGKPTCIWYVTLKLKVSGPSPITVLDSAGKYEPGEGGWLSVAFKPTMEMTYEGVLIFSFHMNPTKMVIPVSGQGVVPHVHVIGPNVVFPPTLPWSDTTDSYFGITNPCPFPVELIITHSDQMWEFEDNIYQLLYKYYNEPEEMLVPAIRPGSGLPSEIVNFYLTFTEHVKKALNDELIAAKVTSARASLSAKKIKSPKSTSVISTPSIETSPRKFKTEAEIVADEMKVMKDSGVDPLKVCLKAFDKSGKFSSDKHEKGLIIFVHGSPCGGMDCQEIAYSLTKKLGIPAMSFDNCIVEALCGSECPAKLTIVSAINESFVIARAHTKDPDDSDENHDDFFNESDDEFSILRKKIEFLASNKNVGTPHSKVIDKKKKSSFSMHSHTALAAMGSTTMFQMDLVEELLKDFFNLAKFNRGFIIDSLTSIMVKNPPEVLTTVLKCKHSIWNIHLILCQLDFSKWAQMYEETQKNIDLVEEILPKDYTEEEIEEIVESFAEMDDEEYENAPSELKSIYITYGLEARRRKYLNKKEDTKQNITPNKTVKETNSTKDKASKDTRAGGDTSDMKKKPKKDEIKGKPTPEFAAMQAKYNDYTKNVYENLISIANNWIIESCELGSPLLGLNGQIMGVGQAQKKTKRKSETQIQLPGTSSTERGFPLTLITCPCLNYKEAVVEMFARSPLVKEALKIEPEIDILKSRIRRKVFTVLLPKVLPHIHHEESLKWLHLDESPIKKCECNQLTNINLLDDTTQDNVLNILTKWHCTCGKKVTSTITSTREIPSSLIDKEIDEENEVDYYYQPEPLHQVKSIPTTSERLILEPGDLVRCKYSFNPQAEGIVYVKRYVEVSGWPDSRVDINVTGVCDLPRLDSRPKKMFKNFVRSTVEDKVYKLTYLDDMKIFEFGPIFIGQQRIYEEEYSIDLKNPSLLTANVVIEFLEDSSVFRQDKTNISLEPGCRGNLTISAAPVSLGVNESVLVFCVKDNPEIITVNFGCSGVKPVVEILPLTKIIEYGRLLLYRRGDDRFIVKNDSLLPIMWKIRNPEEFIENFIISSTSGIVPKNDNQIVPLTYIACNVGVITNLTLIIDIYDELGRGNPMLTENLFVSAECYDVMVECAFQDPEECSLNYGNVKVNSTEYKEMVLINKGKYNIYYKLKKVKNFPEPSLLRSFEATNEYGVIPPANKKVTIEFECTPTTSMNLKNVPVYMCSLLDGNKEQAVVAKFPICVTIASFYNTFTLFPLGELNFNVIAVGSEVTKEVILNNTNKCPFTFEIILPAEYNQIDPEVPSPKLKDKKITNPPLQCGNFRINNEDSLVAPGTSRAIQIQFLATAPRKFEETIKFIISDCEPAEAQGVPLKLVGIGAIPTLDFWNVETTFREHLIVKDLSEYQVRDSSPHCVFVENSTSLHFFGVNVNTSFTGFIDLYNNGLVACALSMVFHYQTNSNSDIFSLEKYNTYIEPLVHKRLGIIFSPKVLTEYRAILEIKLKISSKEEKSFKICLIGEGVMPRIQLVTPLVRQRRIAVLTFPVTCLGSVSSKPICFKNISGVKALVLLEVIHTTIEERPVFYLTTEETCQHMVFNTKEQENMKIQILLKPEEIAKVNVHFDPIKRGKRSCDVKLTIFENPFEYFNVICEAEAFMEDVILIGLELISMDIDLETYKTLDDNKPDSTSTTDSKMKSRTAPLEQRKSTPTLSKKGKKPSSSSMKQSDSENWESSVLKYILDYGGCELCTMHKRSVTMMNNSEKVYNFVWAKVDNILVKPSMGYISPGEEKDLEITFYAGEPMTIKKETLMCNLNALSDNTLTIDMKGSTWDNRQLLTVFDRNREVNLNERVETIVDEQLATSPTGGSLGSITMVIIYSAVTEYTKYRTTLEEEKHLKDTFVYQTRSFTFDVENIGNVPMKVAWSFTIDEELPSRIDKYIMALKQDKPDSGETSEEREVNTCNMDANQPPPPTNGNGPSKVTLFSESTGRDSLDTWFEIDLPFVIEPSKECFKPGEIKTFVVTFAPLEAFDFKVKLRSIIDNLDPYDQNMFCKMTARSLIPYVHLDVEESDYITAGRRKTTGIVLPENITVLEFNVLGWGCFKKSFNVINPTKDAYEFIFDKIISKLELVPIHCDKLKGFIEGGTSTEVTFTFAPTAPGVYESQWKFYIPKYNVTVPLLVVGLVREPDVFFVPTILIIRNSLVGFTSTNVFMLKNNENETLNFEFKGNSLCSESGNKTPVIMEPERGVLKPRSETPIQIFYTPVDDGPLSFKIYCSVMFLTKYLSLCVNALSLSVKPKVLYYIVGNEHVLNSNAITNIHLDQTASTYERVIPFIIRNEGSATFFFDWKYTHSGVKKYLQVNIDPKSCHVTPGNEVECKLSFTLKQVPVQAYPVTLYIADGPEYNIYLHAEIEKPDYHFSCCYIDFGKCIVNAPDATYKKIIAFTNDDKVPIILSVDFESVPELFIEFDTVPLVEPGERLKIPFFFRPKQVREYEFEVVFWMNSLCKQIITVKGEGVALLFDLYEGCQKSFDLGPVKVGHKIIRTIEVMNHSKVAIDATFVFKDMYPVIEDTLNSEATSICLNPDTVPMPPAGDGPSRGKMLQNYKDNKVREQISKDMQNALASLKAVPNRCIIKPHRKVPIKIQFKPIGMIKSLDVQMNMKVLEFERPLVKLSGSATGMSLTFSQNSLDFGKVRRRGCKILKVMLLNEGDFGARFWWQPLMSDEFSISPQTGHIAAHTNVTFSVTFRPLSYNPFIKVWASCNIENYMHLEIAMYATCVDFGNVQKKILNLDCPVREVKTDYVTITNSSDDKWLVLSEMSGGPFDTLKEFIVEPNSTLDVPVKFIPKVIGKHESQVLYSPLGQNALLVNLVGLATPPNPNGNISIVVAAKEIHIEKLLVYNLSENPETYLVVTEVVKTTPDKFDGFYEVKHPDKIKVWGEVAATCRWTIICYEECEIQLKVMFINELSREYQFYSVTATITPCKIIDTIVFESRAREMVQKRLTFANPLSVDAEFFIRCLKLTTPNSVLVNRKSEAVIELTYNPLVEGETEDFLEIANVKAGTFIYKVLMKCLPAKEKDIEVSTPIGTWVPLRLRVQNNTNVKTNFITTLSDKCIQANPEYSLGPYEKGKLLVRFEPVDLGGQNCRVTFDSPFAGRFVFNIIGKGLDPKPQGPYVIKPGAFTQIKFKNVFHDRRIFKIYVDKDEFYVDKMYENVQPKEHINIMVYLRQGPESGWTENPTGTLTIEISEPPTPKVSWSYFLQGI